MPARTVNVRRTLILILALVLGLGVLAYYTHWLYREDLKDWQVLKVTFEDVGGLEEKDEVQSDGVKVGRVKSIQLYGDRQLATLQVEPYIEVRENDVIEIVTTNLIGIAAVRLRAPRDGERGRLVIPGDVLEGQLVAAASLSPGGQGARLELTRDLQNTARRLEDLQDPDSGAFGRFLFSREQAQLAAQSLAELERLWTELDLALAELARGQGAAGTLLVGQEALYALRRTMLALRVTMEDLRDRLRGAENGDGTPGRVLSDPVFAAEIRAATARVRQALDLTRAGQGGLGALVRPEPHAELVQLAEGTSEVSGAARRGEGVLGALTSVEAGEVARRTLSDAADSLEDLAESPAFVDAEGSQRTKEGLQNVDDFLHNIRRTIKRLKEELPNRENFSGVLFQAVF